MSSHARDEVRTSSCRQNGRTTGYDPYEEAAAEVNTGLWPHTALACAKSRVRGAPARARMRAYRGA
ncbi:hypothetical protein PLICRDRAFT_180328 [Plicaturopsis crispa FD-325 SS-3]|uniref:Uncharacterized protein n=1 Tax=Plicaturopsis crispa FD-325 SS-3 TaxID=944288 RepID=A0A0C9SQB5_PLICR|nr:hypothetical protein PLICRDRAFT_180328 [Plicaturopsis crispa FD-325 SS-3]